MLIPLHFVILGGIIGSNLINRCGRSKTARGSQSEPGRVQARRIRGGQMGFQGRGESDEASIPRRDVRVKDEQRVSAVQSGFFDKTKQGGTAGEQACP